MLIVKQLSNIFWFINDITKVNIYNNQSFIIKYYKKLTQIEG